MYLEELQKLVKKLVKKINSKLESKNVGSEQILATKIRNYFLNFQKAMQNCLEIEETMHGHNSKGERFLINANRKEKILNFYETAIDQLAQYFKCVKEGVIPSDSELEKQLRSFQNLAGSRYRMLLQYDPEKGVKSARTLEEDACPPCLYNRGKDKPIMMGAHSNQRQVLSFVDDNGKKVGGLFTRKKIFEPIRLTQEALEQVASNIQKMCRDPDLAQQITPQITNLLNKIAAKYEGTSEEQKQMAAVCLMENCLRNDNGMLCDPSECNDYRCANGIAICLSAIYDSGITGAYLIRECGNDVFKPLIDLIQKNCAYFQTGVRGAHIMEGSRTDSRNTLASTVATLLGLQDIVVQSFPATLVEPDRKKTEGTYTVLADGVDPAHLNAQASQINVKSLTPEYLKSVTDGGVLGYITGNTDQHANNASYRINPNGTLGPMQFFDSDCNFGLAMPDKEGCLKYLASPEKMGFIAKSTADKVLALSPKKLRAAITGAGLRDEEIEKALERLQTLKKHIKDSEKWYNFGSWKSRAEKDCNFTDQCHVRIIPDNQIGQIVYSKYKYLDYSGQYENGTIQNAIYNYIDIPLANFRATYLQQQKNKDPKKKSLKEYLTGITPIGADNRMRRDGFEYHVKRLDKWGEKLEKARSPERLAQPKPTLTCVQKNPPPPTLPLCVTLPPAKKDPSLTLPYILEQPQLTMTVKNTTLEGTSLEFQKLCEAFDKFQKWNKRIEKALKQKREPYLSLSVLKKMNKYANRFLDCANEYRNALVKATDKSNLLYPLSLDDVKEAVELAMDASWLKPEEKKLAQIRSRQWKDWKEEFERPKDTVRYPEKLPSKKSTPITYVKLKKIKSGSKEELSNPEEINEKQEKRKKEAERIGRIVESLKNYKPDTTKLPGNNGNLPKGDFGNRIQKRKVKSQKA